VINDNYSIRFEISNNSSTIRFEMKKRYSHSTNDDDDDDTCLSWSLQDTNIRVVPNVNSVGAADSSPIQRPPRSRSFLKTTVHTKYRH